MNHSFVPFASFLRKPAPGALGFHIANRDPRDFVVFCLANRSFGLRAGLSKRLTGSRPSRLTLIDYLLIFVHK